MVSSFLSVNLIGFIGVVRHGNFKLLKFRDVRELIKDVRYFFMSSVVGSGYQYFDQLLVGLLMSKSEVAMLNILKQLIAMLGLVPTTVNKYLIPIAIKSYQDRKQTAYHKKYDHKVISCIIIIFIISIFFSQKFLSVFTGDSYNFDFFLVFVTSLLFMVSSFSVFIDNQYNIPSRMERITTYSNLIVLVVMLLLIGILASFWALNGVILTLFIAEFIGLIFMTYNLRKL